MRIVHLLTSTSGGAGLAAIRLHKAMLSQGLDSNLLFLIGDAKIDKAFQYKLKNRFLKRIENKILELLGKRKYPKKPVSGIEIFTTPYSQCEPENHPLVQSADIVHLHWVADFVNYATFFSTIDKPVFWTIHDMNPFLGGVHYEGDLDRLNDDARSLERFYCEQKGMIYSKASIFPIFLSSWMRDKAMKYSFPFTGPVIPNCIDLNVFKFYSGNDFKEVFNIGTGRKVFLLIAESLENKRKGVKLLLESLKQYDKFSERVSVVALGNASDSTKKNYSYVNFVSPINDERLLNLLLNSVDYLIIPSVEDNLPNTMLEAMMAGCPVIASNNGGMKEHLSKNNIGWTYDNMDQLMGLISKISVSGDILDNLKIRDYAETTFSFPLIVERVKEYYQENIEIKS